MFDIVVGNGEQGVFGAVHDDDDEHAPFLMGNDHVWACLLGLTGQGR